jgi:hypothetical protein
MTVGLRLSEGEARTFLLVQAVEETDHDGVLLTPHTRAASTRCAFDAPAGATADPGRLRARASLLRDDLLREAPVLERVLLPPRWSGAAVLATLAVAAAAGALTNALGPARHVSVLAFPLVGIVLWNLAVYAALALRALARLGARVRGARGPTARLAFLGRWLERARMAGLARRLGGSARSAAVADAVQRFQRLWLAAAAPLVASRVRVVLHVAALATALGAIGGMYVSGIAFEYRATWESTWLDAPAVQRYLDVVLWPAARLLDLPVPDVAPLRGPAGDGDAAPWIHLWGTTIALFVVAPRAALALLEALNAARLSRWLPVAVDADYARQALHSGRGAARPVEVVYYSCAPDAALRERLHTRLQDEAGARAVVRDAVRLEYGDGPERVALEDGTAAGTLVVVFALAQTPEAEVHGEFLEGLQERLHRAGWPLAVVLETSTYRQRVGSDDRVRERRATWDRLLRDLGLTAVELA